MTEPTNCHVVLMTPTGRGAVASLLIDGADAAMRIDRLFQAASRCVAEKMVEHRIHFGRWHVGSAAYEETVVCRRGTERFEVHCHGGMAAAEAIMLSLEDAGCRRVEWQRWLRRPTNDPLCANSRVALAHALTDRAARILLDQHRGVLSSAIERIVDQLQSNQCDTARTDLEKLLRWSRLGLHLTQPWNVVLAGPANVGKSSLINALVGYRRAIVHDLPGTTRDAISADTAFNGWPVRLTDTAGLRPTTSSVEAAGIAKALGQLQEADLAILVFDATDSWSDEHQQLSATHPGALIIHNKCDLMHETAPRQLPGLLTSAITGDGVSRLSDRIVSALVPDEPPPGTPVPFTREQFDTLAACRDATASGSRREALHLLQSLLTQNA